MEMDRNTCVGFFIIVVFITGFGCLTTQDKKEPIQGSQLNFELSFNPESYPWLMGTKYPQLALWIETDKGKIKTIFISKGAGKDDWYFADKRPASVPVWYGIKGKEAKDEVDAVTGATPDGEVHTISWPVPNQFKGKKVALFLEANVSFDYNDYYKKGLEEGNKGYSAENGQPSMVWRADTILEDTPLEIEPILVGHGQVLGKNHQVDPDLSHITTAAELFNYINIKYNP